MLMRRLGHFVTRYRKTVLIAAVAIIPIGGLIGGRVADHLGSGGFAVPEAQSYKAEQALDDLFATGPPNLVLLVTAKQGTVDEGPVRDRGLALTEQLSGEPEVVEALSYWSTGNAPPLRGTDGSQALVLGRVPGDEDELREAADRLTPKYTLSTAEVTVGVGGIGEIFREASEQSEKDLQIAEVISLPVTMILLVLVFGSAVAAGLPIGVGILSIILTFVVLRLIAMVTDVSIFALNLTTGMGLGLAIDYSLFIVSRYREEVANGYDTDRAITRTMYTAGRTVAFSALTVAISLIALLFFPMGFFRSFAYAGVAVVIMAGLVSIIVLPAALASLGPRLESWSLFKHKAKPIEEGFWYKRARWVMRYPVPVAVGVTLVLVALAIPFLRLELGQPDDRVLPPEAGPRRVHDELRRNFASNEAGALAVILPNAPGGDPKGAEVDRLATQLSKLKNVVRVDAATGFYVSGQHLLGPGPLNERFAKDGATWFSVVPSIEPFSVEGEQLVKDARALNLDGALVGGLAAALVDTKDVIISRLPIAIAFMAVATFVLLFLMVGSLLVPAKALVLNVLSLTATFGALVWVFQDGHLSSILGFTATGSIAVFLPISMFCIAFGLSMDYEVFLLARIKEHYDLHGDNEDAVAHGLQLSGRIVTAAAVLLAVVFLAFATAKVSLVKTFGVGLALAILVDAFIIRATLVPALMRIAGRANWWSPRRLRRLHLRIGIWEPEPIDLLDSPEIARLKELAAKPPTQRTKAKARPKSTSKAKAKPKTKPKTRPRR